MVPPPPPRAPPRPRPGDDNRKPAAIVQGTHANNKTSNISGTTTRGPFLVVEANLLAQHKDNEGDDYTDTGAVPPPLIHWKGEEYEVPEPRRCGLQECLQNLVRKVRVEEAITRTTEPKLKAKLKQLQKILHEFVEQQHERRSNGNDEWVWQLRDVKGDSSLKQDRAGLYLVGYRKLSFSGSWELKFGMSFRCYLRVMEQGRKFAAKVMDREELLDLVSAEFVSRIIDLKLPGLSFHPNHQSHLQDLIRMQLMEIWLACSYECSTNTVGERFTQLPSARVRKILEPRSFTPQMLQFAENIDDQGVFGQLTWPTLPSRIREIALMPQHSFLQQRLHPAPPAGGFVTANRLIELLGPKFGGFKDSLQRSPREAKLDEIIESLQPLLEGTVDAFNPEECTIIRSTLEPIQGDNKSHYVRPSRAALAEGARQLLRELLNSLPANHVIMVERVTVHALEVECSHWFETVIDMSTAIDVVPDDPRSLCLVRARSGHRIIITLSFFMAFAEKVPMEVRFRCITAYITCLDFMEASGNQSLEKVEQQRAILGSFLMGLEFGQQSSTSTTGIDDDASAVDDDAVLPADCRYSDDDLLQDDFDDEDGDSDDDDDDDADDNSDDDASEDDADDADYSDADASADDTSNNKVIIAEQYRKPRLLTFPNGYFKGPRFSVLGVSKALKIGYAEMLYIRVQLGADKFNQLLIAHGLLYQGRQASSPLELSFACPGVPACPGFEQEPCAWRDRDDVTPQVIMVGGGARQCHPCFGLFVCRHCCYKKIARREQQFLEELESTGAISNVQQNRLVDLRARVVPARMANAASARRQSHRQQKLIADGNEKAIKKREERKVYLSERYHGLAAEGVKVTSTGSDRKMKGKKLYPEPFMKLLGRATGVWIEVYGRSVVMWPDLVALFGELLVRESPKYPNEKTFIFLPDGQPRYYHHAYTEAVKPYLDPPTEERGKTWSVKNSDKSLVPYGRKEEITVVELRQRALQILYSDPAPKEPTPHQDEQQETRRRRRRQQ